MTVFNVKNLAKIEGEVEFGALTFLVGPNTTGKSLFLQAWKLAQDAEAIAVRTHQYGVRVLRSNTAPGPHDYDLWSRSYFGGGFRGMLRDVELVWEGERFRAERLWENDSAAEYETTERRESVFYIPSQRTLAFDQEGWVRSYKEFVSGTPYVVRIFGDILLHFLRHNFTGTEGSTLFPAERLTTKLLRGGEVAVYWSLTGGVRLFIKEPNGEERPYVNFSNGQRHAIPLLLGLYSLITASLQEGDRREEDGGYKWIVIEEPEAGLHPSLISDLLVLVLDLIRRGYKVVMTTHSATVLTFAWVLRFAFETWNAGKEEIVVAQMRELLDIPATYPLKETLRSVLGQVRTYYFKPVSNRAQGSEETREWVQIVDISSLDAFATPEIADWGGLTTFATRADDVVATLAGA